jgi:hypothetical protein
LLCLNIYEGALDYLEAVPKVSRAFGRGPVRFLQVILGLTVVITTQSCPNKIEDVNRDYLRIFKDANTILVYTLLLSRVAVKCKTLDSKKIVFRGHPHS